MFDSHHKTELHQNLAKNFLGVYLKQQGNIQKNLNCLEKRQAIANRDRFVPIIQTVIFCGQQELALRGHRDGEALSISLSTENDGNFRAALRLRLQAGDEVRKEHLENSAANSTYLSWRTQ